MPRQKIKDSHLSGEVPEQLLKFADGSTTYMKVVDDAIAEWQEIWPTFATNNGEMKRRFIISEDGANVKSLDEYKKAVDIPQEFENNWRPKPQYALLVIIGHPQKVKDKETGKTRTKIIWDSEVKIWQFGIKVYRAIKRQLNKNDELIEAAEEKGIDMNEHQVSEVYSLKYTKTKLPGSSFNVEYNVEAYKLIGVTDTSKLEDYDEVVQKMEDYIEPDKASAIESFVKQNAEGISEPESEEEEDAPAPKKKAKVVEPEDEDVEIDEEEEEAPAPKKKAKVVEPEEEEEEEAPAPKKKVKATEPEEEEVDDEEEEAPAPKKKAKVVEPEDEEEEEIDPDDEEEEAPAPKKKVK